MLMCSRCHKRPAVVFISQSMDTANSQGLCLVCAKELGIKPVNDLMEKMGNEAFDYYADKLSSYIVQTGRKVRSHYRTILQWWQEDRQVKEGDAYAL